MRVLLLQLLQRRTMTRIVLLLLVQEGLKLRREQANEEAIPHLVRHNVKERKVQFQKEFGKRREGKNTRKRRERRKGRKRRRGRRGKEEEGGRRRVCSNHTLCPLHLVFDEREERREVHLQPLFRHTLQTSVAERLVVRCEAAVLRIPFEPFGKASFVLNILFKREKVTKMRHNLLQELLCFFESFFSLRFFLLSF